MNLLSALAAYCFFDKKPAIQFEREKDYCLEGRMLIPNSG
jgi:hypothetical protein